MGTSLRARVLSRNYEETTEEMFTNHKQMNEFKPSRAHQLGRLGGGVYGNCSMLHFMVASIHTLGTFFALLLLIFFPQFALSSDAEPIVTRSRIELHFHLDGAVRPETIWNLSIQKGRTLYFEDEALSNARVEIKTLDQLKYALKVQRPSSLEHFLTKLGIYVPLLVGDLVAIERIAYEACQDQASQGVIYFEARYSPHLLSNTIPTFYVEHPLSIDDPKAVTPDDVVLAVQRGFHRGQSQFGVKVRHIMCSIKKMNWTVDCVALAARHRSFVVAIDLAGNEDNEYTEDEITGFQTAAELNIHRTVHAGESGPAENVQRALSTLYAERIGHGYHVVENKTIYDECKKRDVHFETCPYSSGLTNSVPRNSSKRHPIVTFALDQVNFSVSKDDPTVTETVLNDEYELLKSWGLNEVHLVRANINAARSCFLPDDEKTELVRQLFRVFGFEK